MVPRSKSAEFFGFFSVSEKFAGIMGPFVFAVVGQLMGSSRLSIVSLVIFFIIGAVLLSRVNEKPKASASPSRRSWLSLRRQNQVEYKVWRLLWHKVPQ